MAKIVLKYNKPQLHTLNSTSSLACVTGSAAQKEQTCTSGGHVNDGPGCADGAGQGACTAGNVAMNTCYAVGNAAGDNKRARVIAHNCDNNGNAAFGVGESTKAGCADGIAIITN